MGCVTRAAHLVLAGMKPCRHRSSDYFSSPKRSGSTSASLTRVIWALFGQGEIHLPGGSRCPPATSPGQPRRPRRASCAASRLHRHVRGRWPSSRSSSAGARTANRRCGHLRRSRRTPPRPQRCEAPDRSASGSRPSTTRCTRRRQSRCRRGCPPATGPAGQTAVGKRIEPEGNSTGIGHGATIGNPWAGDCSADPTLAPMLRPPPVVPRSVETTRRFALGWTIVDRIRRVRQPAKRPPHPTLPRRAGGVRSSRCCSRCREPVPPKGNCGLRMAHCRIFSISRSSATSRRCCGVEASRRWGTGRFRSRCRFYGARWSMPAGARSLGEHAGHRDRRRGRRGRAEDPVHEQRPECVEIMSTAAVVSLLVLAVVAALSPGDRLSWGRHARACCRGSGPVMAVGLRVSCSGSPTSIQCVAPEHRTDPGAVLGWLCLGGAAFLFAGLPRR